MKKQAKTAAERQKAYRERRAQHAGEERINAWVSARAHKVLASMAVRYGVTQKVMLERLLLKADDGVVVAASRPHGRTPQVELPRLDFVTQSHMPAQSALWDEPVLIAQPKGVVVRAKAVKGSKGSKPPAEALATPPQAAPANKATRG